MPSPPGPAASTRTCREAGIGHWFLWHQRERQHTSPTAEPVIFLVVDRRAVANFGRCFGDLKFEQTGRSQFRRIGTTDLGPAARNDMLRDDFKTPQLFFALAGRGVAENDDRAVVHRVME